MRGAVAPVAKWACLALAVSIAASSCSGPRTQPRVEGPLDFGDAPDGNPTGYPDGGVGKFPSLLRSNGARASTAGLHLGPQVDAEPDAKQRGQEFHNDGVVLAGAVSCQTGTLSVLVTLDQAAPSGGATVYFNFWADWDHDAAWAGEDRCAPEHAVADRVLTVRAGERLVIFEVKFEFGEFQTPFWSRSILSAAPLRRAVPTGSVGPGEVEDYPMPFFLPTAGVACGRGTVGHGRDGLAPINMRPAVGALRFTEVDSQDLPRWTARLPAPGGRTLGPGLPRALAPTPQGLLRGRILLRSLAPDRDRPFRFELRKVHGRVVPRRGFQRVFTCEFIVVHGVPIRESDEVLEPGVDEGDVFVDLSYSHESFTDASGTFPSRICAALRTSPPARNADARVTLSDRTGAVVFEGTVRLDADGKARRDFGINAFETYTLLVKVRNVSAKKTIVVTAAPGAACPV